MDQQNNGAEPAAPPVEVKLPLITLVGKHRDGQMIIETNWANVNLAGVVHLLRSTVDSLTDRLVDQQLQTATYAPVNIAGADLVRGLVPGCDGVECTAENDMAARDRLRTLLRDYIVKRLDEQGGLSLPHSHAVDAAPAV